MKRFGLFGILFVLAACSGASKKPTGEKPALDEDSAYKAAKLAIECVEKEEPHYDEGQGQAPHAAKLRSPAFYGCFDWHSAVQGHWAMLRVANSLPTLSLSDEISEILTRHLTAENMKVELAHLQKQPGFEEPYGWGWFLRLVQELHGSSLSGAPKWSMAAVPLEQKIVKLYQSYLKKTRLANRVGLHDNTAYSMIHAWDYASKVNDARFLKELSKKAKAFYQGDHDCLFASEPGPRDFISPCLAEADLMRRVLIPEKFIPWFNKFLPKLSAAQLKPLQAKSHAGLLFQRASAMQGVASQLPDSDPRRKMLLQAAQEHSDAAWGEVADSGSSGKHWLGSFAVYYYSAVGL